MAVSKEEVVDFLSNMPVIELAEMVKELEDKWGVSAAAPVAMAAGPAAGGAAASYIASPVGQAAVEKAVAITVGNSGSTMQNMAMGGLVMNPTLAMIGEAGPELVVPLKKKRSRSARASDKKLSKAFKEANARLRTRNGSLRKGKTQADVARLAHRLRKKM